MQDFGIDWLSGQDVEAFEVCMSLVDCSDAKNISNGKVWGYSLRDRAQAREQARSAEQEVSAGR